MTTPAITPTTAPMPALYLPHGGGPAFFMSGKMHDMFADMQVFLAGVADSLPATPKAILLVTAHWEAEVPSFTGSARPELIYDYYGFPPETYAIQYPAPAAPWLAEQAAALLQEAGIESRVEPAYGWDHGVFIPLKVMFPQAHIPVVAMSLQSGLNPRSHADMGRALRSLRQEGVLIVGSGMSYHNLREIWGGNGRKASEDFDAWLDHALAGDEAARSAQLSQWAQAPAARAAHPREEHLLPLMVVSGAGGDAPANKIWSAMVGDNRISAWSFT